MKKRIIKNGIRCVSIVLTILIICNFFALFSFAHSGGTDSSGGHYDHSTVEYHYHHGKSAHQHKNWKCPYDISGLIGLIILMWLLFGWIIALIISFIFNKIVDEDVVVILFFAIWQLPPILAFVVDIIIRIFT